MVFSGPPPVPRTLRSSRTRMGSQTLVISPADFGPASDRRHRVGRATAAESVCGQFLAPLKASTPHADPSSIAFERVVSASGGRQRGTVSRHLFAPGRHGRARAHRWTGDAGDAA